MSCLTDHEEIDGGYVAFGGKPKGGKSQEKEPLKMHKASCKSKIENSINLPLHLLHMDLFGPTFVKSLMKKMYCLVVTDDYNRIPTLSFMRPFGCPVTILNTIDHLGKSYGKADEGLFIGYSLNCKAFRVFNSRTRIVEETLHIRFSESTPNVVGTRSNSFAGTKGSDNADLKSSHNDGSKPSTDDGKKVDEDPSKQSECNDQEKEDNVNNTNNVNTVSSTINAAGTNEVNVDSGIISSELPFDPNMPALEDVSIFNFSKDDEDADAMADIKIWILQSKRGVCMSTLGFEDPDFLDRVYKFEKALYGLHQAPRAWYETLSTYLWTIGFIEGKLTRPYSSKRYKGDILMVQVYVDDIIFGSTKKEICIGFEKLMHEKFQMSSIRELTFFLGLQVKQKKAGTFISQDKYVYEILKKFRFTEFKTASTPMETQKPLLKDENGEEVDVHMYRSMIGSLMYLTSSRPDIMFAVCAYARYQVDPKVSHFHAMKKIFRLISWQCKKQTMVANSTTKAEYVAASSCRGQFWSTAMVKTINEEAQLYAKVDGKKIIVTESFVRRDLRLADEEGIDCLPNSTIFEQLALMGCQETIRDTTAQTRFESVSKHFDNSLLAGDGKEVFVARQNENAVKEVVDAAQVSSTATNVTITTKEITLDQALEALKTSKPKAKRAVIQDLSESRTTIPKQQLQDKGKGIMIEESVKPKKKKDQIRLDEEAALKLQDKFDEEERLAREKEQEANIALIETWDDIQAKIDADHQLAKRLQAQEQEEEDLEDLYKLVKARYGSTRSMEIIDYLLWNDLKTMFEPHVEDEVWKMQQGYKVLELKLYDSCRVHSLMMQSMQIYMLVEKKYPLTPPTLSMMLKKKLQIDYESEMAYQLPSEAKIKYKKKVDELVTYPKKKPVQATKGTRLNSKSKVTNPDMKKQPAKKTKAKGLVILSEVALSEDEQIKLATKRSKEDFHISHASGLDEGADTILGVPDVPPHESKSKKESWGDSKDEDDNDDDGDNEDDGDNDDDGESDDHDDERIESDSDEIPNPNLTNIDQTKYEEDDEVIKDLYNDVNVNLGFKQEEEDTHVTLTPVHYAQKADEPVQSSYVSSDFTRKLLNLENPSLEDNKKASLMETSAPHATTIPEITSGFTTTTPPPPSVSALESEISELKQTDQFTEAVSSISGIVDKYLASKMKDVVNVAVQLQTNKLEKKLKPGIKNSSIRSTNQPQTAYAVAALLPEFDLKKILIDKIEANKSINRLDTQKNLYNALFESYNYDTDIITSYGDVVLLKRGQDDQDNDEDPFAKGRKEGNLVKMLSPLKIQEEPSHIIEESGMQQDQEFVTGDNDEQTINKEVTKAEWFKKPERPSTPDPDWSKRRQINFQPPQTWITQAALAEEPLTSFDEFNDTLFDFSAFVLNRLKIPNLTQEILVGPSFKLLKGTCKSITELEYHLEECSKPTTERLD
uniref:Putative ribonuclease H-like domain-containing protein n=1 Tax=Tanacetum cinerariifolium TaxID=118510 RepID=A0A699GX72_TANCI|nr:putative ribonuclease H-like domain-containing protein [Tanacetum cinerariifolium]